MFTARTSGTTQAFAPPRSPGFFDDKLKNAAWLEAKDLIPTEGGSSSQG